MKQTPQTKFKFKAGAAGSSKKHTIKIVPIFNDEKPADKSLGIPALQKVLDLHRSLGAFKGEASQCIHVAEHGVLLGGLGARARFHPETCAALFRQLGERTARYKDVVLEIIVSSALAEAVEEYSRRAGQAPALALDLGRPAGGAKKTAARSAKKAGDSDAESTDESGDGDSEGEGNGETSGSPDYVSEYSVEELISQMATCMQIGADAMRVLKGEQSAREAEWKGVGKKKTASAAKSKDAENSVTETSVRATVLKNEKVSAALTRGALIGDVVNRARYIASLPGNYLNPEQYETYARAIAKEYGLKIKVWNVPALEKLGCGGILAVGRGSEIPPRMVHVE